MSDTTHLNGRLTAETLDAYFSGAAPRTIALVDDPRCLLRIDPQRERLELWLRNDRSEVDPGDLARIDLDREHYDDEDWLVIGIDASAARVEAYGLLAAVVDDVVDGQSNALALRRSIDSFRDILARRTRMSDEKMLGLLGELVVLDHLAARLEPRRALEAWLGPDSEEHDFVLDDVDIEVKTTASEQRRHRISSETQLQPSPGRPLWLLSLQYTRGGDAAQGIRLGDMVARVRQRFAPDTTALDLKLRTQGWRDEDDRLYRSRFVPRSTPAAFLVDDRFPAVTRRRLDDVVPRAELVGGVSYYVDVTSLEQGTPPSALADLVQGGVH